MTTIWKFPLLSTGPCEIDVPLPGAIRLVDRDPATGLGAFWAEVHPAAAVKARRFEIVGTGHPVPADAEHVGSFVQGDYVWHLFELPEGPGQAGDA